MNSLLSSPAKRVLLTGGAGFLGRHLTERLNREFSLRVLDVAPVEGVRDFVEGSVADTALADRAAEGMDALVIAHMAPNRDDAYESVDLPFDINVKGTAALFQAAVRRGARRVVLVSSISVVDGSRIKGDFLDANLSFSPQSLYGLTKVLQEETARFYHHKHGLEVAIIRPAYVILEDPLEDKYGKTPPTVNWQFIDPRDIAEAVALALVHPKIGFEIFYPLGGPGADQRADVARLRATLGWQARHSFNRHPADR